MNTFNANFSSSPVSNQPSLPSDTPPRRNVLFQQSEHASTTPAAPPPSQIFGSSQYTGVGKIQLKSGPLTSSAPRQFQSSRTRINTPGRPRSQLFQSSTHSNESMEEDYTDDVDGAESEDMDQEWENQEPAQSMQYRPGFATNNLTNNKLSAPSLMKFSVNSNRQSLVASTRKAASRPSKSQLPRKGREDLVPGLVRDLTRRIQPASLSESDTVILETEQVCRQLEEAYQDTPDELSQRIIVSGGAQELIHLWKRSSKPFQVAVDQVNIGPAASAPLFDQARYIATLLLELYHPPAQQNGASRNSKSVSLSDGHAADHNIETKPMPQVILEWLNQNHVNYDYLLEQVISHNPNCTSSDIFWEALETLTLRGRFTEVGHILAEADFNYAVVDTPQGFVEANYSGKQLQKIQSVIVKARQTFNACPAYQTGDWNTDGQDWEYFRNQVEEALAELATMSDSIDENETSDSNSADFFGNSTRGGALPFSILQHLQSLYFILLGDANVIMGMCQDWLEASLMLTVWWNGAEQAKVAQWSFDVSRAHHPEAESASMTSYISRLREAFLCVTDPSADSGFHINTVSSVELGVGAVLQGDIQSVFQILKTMSLCVTSAIIEVGTWAGWNTTASTDGLDQEDLMVLNFGTGNDVVSKDDILITYAEALFKHKQMHTLEGMKVEGWEVAFAIASRLDDRERMETVVSHFIDALSVNDRDRTEKLVTVCQQLGLQAQGRKVSEAFGDHLVNGSTEYGTALLCYARAHSEAKVRQLVDLLNSYCLVQSTAYPPPGELDAALERLVSNPKEALQNIAEVDPPAAEALQFYLVGYACIRRFYTLRDGEVTMLRQGQQKVKRATARALISAINSAADSIYGGLYDPERRSAIQVDGLLSLLGEATALLAHEGQTRVLTSDQMYSLLAAIEDLQTVSDRVYRATEECMLAAIRNYGGSMPPSPHAMLKKSISSGTNSNFSFSMMGSEMLSKSEDSLGGKSAGSAVLIGNTVTSKDTERGWDWRASFSNQDVTGADVLRKLRIGIAKELSIASLEGSNPDF